MLTMLISIELIFVDVLITSIKDTVLSVMSTLLRSVVQISSLNTLYYSVISIMSELKANEVD